MQNMPKICALFCSEKKEQNWKTIPGIKGKTNAQEIPVKVRGACFEKKSAGKKVQLHWKTKRAKLVRKKRGIKTSGIKTSGIKTSGIKTQSSTLELPKDSEEDIDDLLKDMKI